MTEALPGPDAGIAELRQFAAVRLVVADLDGTLFPSELAGTAQRLLRQLQRVHVHLTVATGRTFMGVQELLRRLQGTQDLLLIKRDMPLILYNGSVVVEAGSGQLLRCERMATGALTAILSVARRYPCEVFAYSCDEDIMRRGGTNGVRERVAAWQFLQVDSPRVMREFNGLSVDWREEEEIHGEELPCAVVIRVPDAVAMQALGDALLNLGTVGVTKSGSVYLELRPEGSNKATALAWVADRRGLTAAEVMAVGDNDNDIEMLQWAGLGVAVSTASARACQSADFVCGYGPFQGVVQALRLLHEAHRYHKSVIRKAPG